MAFALRIDDGKHRQATWLELLFDLAFVICVGALSQKLIRDPSWNGLGLYLALFVPVWWIWNQFTWYASHFDNDDRPFRLFMLAGIGGTLALKGGIQGVPASGSLFLGAYIGLHVLLGVGWLRAYRYVPEYRSYIRFKLLGIVLGVLFWGTGFFVEGNSRYLLLGMGVVCQLLMPVFAWATVSRLISVHGHHLLERHGLFTIIVLGESLIALSAHADHWTWESVPVVAGLFLVLVVLWWVYFDWSYSPVNLNHTGRAFAYNYGQLFIYVSLGAFAAGIELVMEKHPLGAGYVVAGVVSYLLSIGFINFCSRARTSARNPACEK